MSYQNSLVAHHNFIIIIISDSPVLKFDSMSQGELCTETNLSANFSAGVGEINNGNIKQLTHLLLHIWICSFASF